MWDPTTREVGPRQVTNCYLRYDAVNMSHCESDDLMNFVEGDASRPRPAGKRTEILGMSVSKRGTKAADTPHRGDRHKYDRLATRQPPAVIEAMNHIAKKRGTTVAAILGDATIKTLLEGRAMLPKKLQRKLRGIAFDP
jgi:hypothetical protein